MPKFNPNTALHVVADSWAQLRACDVDRLICEVAGRQHARAMAAAIGRNRPEYAWMADLCAASFRKGLGGGSAPEGDGHQ